MTRPKTGQGSKPDTGDQINSCGLLQTTHLIFPPGSEAKVFPIVHVMSCLMIKLRMRKSACVLTSVDVSRHILKNTHISRHLHLPFCHTFVPAPLPTLPCLTLCVSPTNTSIPFLSLVSRLPTLGKDLPAQPSPRINLASPA